MIRALLLLLGYSVWRPVVFPVGFFRVIKNALKRPDQITRGVDGRWREEKKHLQAGKSCLGIHLEAAPRGLFFFLMQLKIAEGNVKDLLDESAAFLYRQTKQPLEICFRRLAMM